MASDSNIQQLSNQLYISLQLNRRGFLDRDDCALLYRIFNLITESHVFWVVALQLIHSVADDDLVTVKKTGTRNKDVDFLVSEQSIWWSYFIWPGKDTGISISAVERRSPNATHESI